jgi:hypothetical protein
MTSVMDILDMLFSRRIIVFGGEYGRSKTLSMAAYNYLAWLYNNINTFVTNTPLSFKSANRFVTIKPLLTTDEFDKPYQNTIFDMDEMQENLDARDFMNPKIRYLTHWAKDLRKSNCQVVGTIQYFDFLEMRASQLLQVIIIPSFLNTYHMNEKKDNAMRLEAHDFNVSWYIIDRKVNKEYSIELNLYPYLGMYLTKFQPTQLVANHKDYLFYLKHQKGEKKFNDYSVDIKEHVEYSIENFNLGLHELGLPKYEVSQILT